MSVILAEYITLNKRASSG